MRLSLAQDGQVELVRSMGDLCIALCLIADVLHVELHVGTSNDISAVSCDGISLFG